MMYFRKILFVLCVGLVWDSNVWAHYFGRALQSPAHQACAVHAAQHEKEKGIPRHLLSAISKIESGRKDEGSGKFVAWPWTLNVEGAGYTYPTKEAAIAAVRKFHAQGKKSIDVGCMQVNLMHHPKAFRSLDEALDPRKNIEYASRFLSDLRDTHGSWTQAVAHYHSATQELHIPYRKKVYDLWHKERLKGDVVVMDEGFVQDADSFRKPQAHFVPIPKFVRQGKGPKQVRPLDARAHMALYRERAQSALLVGEKPHQRTPARTVQIGSRPTLQKYGSLRAQARGAQKKTQTPSFIQG